MTVDRVDRAIIAELATDARLSIRTLAERVHISRTQAHNRVQRLVSDGVLTSFAAQVDRKALGLNVTAIVIVKVGNLPWPDMAARLAELPFVEKVQAVSGDIDFVLTVSAPDNESLSAVILSRVHDMPGVISTRSHVILDERAGTAPGAAPDTWA
ncbi:Lrp/AsnC family transcriptional regulator [Subtercola sp. YIM 133946]|uniref:Lrp/AsnC family transcriptional regulator n=1 Tax=Subtercola sp. YIM 133946 TaxID=3118909 RepID=UPI002F93A78C